MVRWIEGWANGQYIMDKQTSEQLTDHQQLRQNKRRMKQHLQSSVNLAFIMLSCDSAQIEVKRFKGPIKCCLKHGKITVPSLGPSEPERTDKSIAGLLWCTDKTRFLWL
ncbi:hypothetical protein AMECASPLE_000418 [Ameca splendens]|uniref:Uncharacterized protein n=1 Tax=Ameca splendens TaxID=208324 RepID=A0ABV0XXJ1_9TELE